MGTANKSRTPNAGQPLTKFAPLSPTPSVRMYHMKSVNKYPSSAASLFLCKFVSMSLRPSVGSNQQRNALMSLYRSVTRCPRRSVGRRLERKVCVHETKKKEVVH